MGWQMKIPGLLAREDGRNGMEEEIKRGKLGE